MNNNINYLIFNINININNLIYLTYQNKFKTLLKIYLRICFAIKLCLLVCLRNRVFD